MTWVLVQIVLGLLSLMYRGEELFVERVGKGVLVIVGQPDDSRYNHNCYVERTVECR